MEALLNRFSCIYETFYSNTQTPLKPLQTITHKLNKKITLITTSLKHKSTFDQFTQ